MKKVLLEEMTWLEAKEILPRVKVGIVPVGSTEQHGRHLPMHVDNVAAVAIATRTAEKLYPNAVVAPSIPVGVSYHHMLFPGSLTLSEDTLIRTAYDFAASLKKHGVPLILFLNGHLGNKTALVSATGKIRRELGVKVIQLAYWDLFPTEHKDIIEDGEIPEHAGEFETALEMYVRGNLVSESFLTREPDAYTMDRRRTDLFTIANDKFPIFGSSKDGMIYGTPEKATAEKGRKIVELCSDEIAKFLKDLFVIY